MTQKEGSLTFRVEDDLKAQFVASCKANDMTAAQVLRAAMRDYLKNHAQTAQSPKSKDNAA